MNKIEKSFQFIGNIYLLGMSVQALRVLLYVFFTIDFKLHGIWIPAYFISITIGTGLMIYMIFTILNDMIFKNKED